MTIINHFPGGSLKITYKDYYTGNDEKNHPKRNTFQVKFQMSSESIAKLQNYTSVTTPNGIYIFGGEFQMTDNTKRSNKGFWKIDENRNITKIGRIEKIPHDGEIIKTDYEESKKTIYCTWTKENDHKIPLLKIKIENNNETETITEEYREYDIGELTTLKDMEIFVIITDLMRREEIYIVGGKRSNKDKREQEIFYIINNNIETISMNFEATYYKGTYNKIQTIICYGGWARQSIIWSSINRTNNIYGISGGAKTQIYPSITNELNKNNIRPRTNAYMIQQNDYIYLIGGETDTGIQKTDYITIEKTKEDACKRCILQTIDNDIEINDLHPKIYSHQLYSILWNSKQIIAIDHSKDTEEKNDPIPSTIEEVTNCNPIIYPNQWILFDLNNIENVRGLEYPKITKIFMSRGTKHTLNGSEEIVQKSSVNTFYHKVTGQVIPPLYWSGYDSNSGLK